MFYYHDDVLDSTQDSIPDHFTPNLPGPYLISAHKQTAGRGTHGRTWHSPVGGVYLTAVSLALYQPGADCFNDIMQHVHVGLQSYTEDVQRLGNDFIIGGAKVAGVLVETEQNEGGHWWIKVGLGCNVMASVSLDRMTTHLADHTAIASLAHVRMTLQQCMMDALQSLPMAKSCVSHDL